MGRAVEADSELRGRHLVRDAGWEPQLDGDLARRRALSVGLVPLDRQLARRRDFVLFKAHPFQFDKLSELVQAHTEQHETYAAEFKVMSDHAIPSEVLDACQHNHYPQFILRNIGRVEKTDCDPDEPLPMERKDGLSSHGADALLDEVRQAEVPRPEMAQIWTLRFVTRVRESLRRLVVEDPWELRFGAEAKANFNGPVYQYIVEGTHPDDLPEAWWGPDTTRGPEQRVTPRGKEREERAVNIYDVIRSMQQGQES